MHLEESKPEIKERTSYGVVARNFFFVALAIGFAYLVTVSIGIEGLRTIAASTGIWGAMAIVLIKATTLVVAPLGGTPVYVIAGAAFGFWKGFFLTLIGDSLGFSIAFFLSRFFGRSIVDFFMSASEVANLERILAKSSTLPALIKARLALTGIPELFAYGAGLTRVSFPVFFLLQMVPYVPLAALLVLFGDALLELAENTTYLIITGGFSALIALIGGWWFHRDIIKES